MKRKSRFQSTPESRISRTPRAVSFGRFGCGASEIDCASAQGKLDVEADQGTRRDVARGFAAGLALLFIMVARLEWIPGGGGNAPAPSSLRHECRDKWVGLLWGQNL
jgi:hypothetical protein